MARGKAAYAVRHGSLSRTNMRAEHRVPVRVECPASSSTNSSGPFVYDGVVAEDSPGLGLPVAALASENRSIDGIKSYTEDSELMPDRIRSRSWWHQSMRPSSTPSHRISVPFDQFKGRTWSVESHHPLLCIPPGMDASDRRSHKQAKGDPGVADRESLRQNRSRHRSFPVTESSDSLPVCRLRLVAQDDNSSTRHRE